MRKNISFDKINIYEIENKYCPSDDIFSEDDPNIDKLKRIIYHKLDDTEKRIMLCYIEIGNLRDTAKLFKVSTSTIYGYIKKIKDYIKYEYYS